MSGKTHLRPRPSTPNPSQRTGPRRPETPDPGAAGPLTAMDAMDLQRSGMGMSAVRAAIAERGGSPESVFDGASSGAAREIPSRGRLEEAFDTDLGEVRTYTGPQVDASLEILGAKAAEQDGSMLLPSQGVTPELLGHEAAHVIQEGSGREGSGGRIADRAEPSETQASDAGRRYAHGEAVQVDRGGSSGLHLWGLADAWDVVDESWDLAGEGAEAAWDTATDVAGQGMDYAGKGAEAVWDTATDVAGHGWDMADEGVDWLLENADLFWGENRK